MIPLLTIDEKSVESQWTEKANADWVKNFCDVILVGDEIPVYQCDDSWVRLGVFAEYKDVERMSVFSKYGYCDTEEALVKFLREYDVDKDNMYFVEIGGLDMNYEKYYKFGGYINKDGEDTGEDYYNYIDEHPEMKVEQDVKGKWIRFCIHKLKK
jgi:hypothetical protein